MIGCSEKKFLSSLFLLHRSLEMTGTLIIAIERCPASSPIIP